MKIIIIIVVVLAILAGLGYFVFLNKEGNTPQDPKLLFGRWINVNKNPNDSYTNLKFLDYLEFKEKEICLGYEQDDKNILTCSKYQPYMVDGQTINVEGNPYSTWRLRGDTLEIQPVFGQIKKETYKRIR